MIDTVRLEKSRSGLIAVGEKNSVQNLSITGVKEVFRLKKTLNERNFNRQRTPKGKMPTRKRVKNGAVKSKFIRNTKR